MFRFISINKKSGSQKRNSLVAAFACFIFLFLFFPHHTSASTGTDPDSGKVKYELNDPRNPDCPCHKYQKLAEDEYKKSLGNNDGNPVNNNDGNSVNNDNNNDVATKNTEQQSTSSANVTSKHYVKHSGSQKKMIKWVKKVKRKMGKKNNGTVKGKRRLADCFHFN